MSRFLVFVLSLFGVVAVANGCRKYHDELDYNYAVQELRPVEDLQFGEIVQFETVFWQIDDTVSLRKLIVEDAICNGRDVLEIGTGTGLIAILCLQNDATKVVATDINPAAVANARYNGAVLVEHEDLDVRLVDQDDPGAFSVLAPVEKFDLVISNPPWEDGVVAKPADHAFYDPNFALMDSILDGLPERLNPGGRCLLSYGHVPAIKRLISEAEKRNYVVKVLDDRDLDALDTDFLPGMLVELRPPLTKTIVSGGEFKSVEETKEEDSQEEPAQE